ncbi:DM13 domain-containing protein [Aestuariimicrobium soli]|uniref:DM13 domain-containing protein n=1 Tax=Aestuariimicrobium soli TaxID=2035834 RepID=UPI003EBCBDB4
MKNTKLLKLASVGLAGLALSFSLAACGGDSMSGSSSMPMNSSSMPMESTSSMPMESTSSMPMESSAAMVSGSFEGLNGKKVAGMVTIEGSMVKLTGFSSDEGPDLHLYLTKGTDEAAVEQGMRIDKVAFDKAEQSFTLSGVDVSGYTNVVVHCDKAKAVFGAATLGS